MRSGLGGSQKHPSCQIKLKRPEKTVDGQLVDFVRHLGSSFGLAGRRELKEPKRSKSLDEKSWKILRKNITIFDSLRFMCMKDKVNFIVSSDIVFLAPDNFGLGRYKEEHIFKRF